MMFVASSELVCSLKKKLLFFSDICVHNNVLAVISDVSPSMELSDPTTTLKWECIHCGASLWEFNGNPFIVTGAHVSTYITWE